MESESKTRLLSEFPPQTYEEWKEAAVQLLKGRPFEKTLITPTYEGFDLQPIYTEETATASPCAGDLPGMGSRVRGSRMEGYLTNGWLVSQELTQPTPTEMNAVALKELENGQNELNLWMDRPTREGLDADSGAQSVGACGMSLSTVGDMSQLLEGIHPEMISLYMQSGVAAPGLYALLLAAVRKSGKAEKDLRGCLGMNPLGWLACTGSLPGDTVKTGDVMAELIQSAASTAPRLQVVDIQGHVYHDGGASSVQELAAILATGVYYLKEMDQRAVPLDLVVPRMRLSVSIGPNYFIEIAKLRALRLLWSRILDAFKVSAGARQVHIHARTGQWNKTLLDPYVNMLRTTTEAFAAVVGGCDSLHVAPFDEIIRESDTFSRRIARNTHAILAEECGMTQVIDPSGGSWAVESLTDEMARGAWEAFQKIEGEGGMLKAMEAGTFQESVESSRQEKMKNIQRRKDVIVGTNTYPNATERLLDPRKVDYEAIRKVRLEAIESWKSKRDAKAVEAALEGVRTAKGPGRMEALVAAAEAGATLGELQAALATGTSPVSARPIRIKRAAEEFEALRMAAYGLKMAGKAPLVHQLNMGPSRRYRIRADWTSAFFQAGGLEVLNEDDYETIEAAIEALKTSGARVAIITSDDETYAESVEPLARAIKAQDAEVQVLVAGAPGETEAAWKSAGVDDFVHVRVNNYTFNRALLEAMGASL